MALVEEGPRPKSPDDAMVLEVATGRSEQAVAASEHVVGAAVTVGLDDCMEAGDSTPATGLGAEASDFSECSDDEKEESRTAMTGSKATGLRTGNGGGALAGVGDDGCRAIEAVATTPREDAAASEGAEATAGAGAVPEARRTGRTMVRPTGCT